MQRPLGTVKKVEAAITPPTSKSISNRALLIQALCPLQRYAITNLAMCDDTSHMQQAITDKCKGISIIDIGATGTAMRFLTAYLAIADGETLLTGSERMQQRPIGTLVEALCKLGANIAYTNKEGYPPLLILGQKLQGGELEIEANISSQYISALLMIGPCLSQGLTLHLKGKIASRSYIELTLSLMRHYGATVEWANDHTIRVEPGRYEDKPLTVEGDWSAASYWYEWAAIASHRGYDVDIFLHGITADSHQGDRIVADLFESLGVKTEFLEGGARLSATSTMHKACTQSGEAKMTTIDFTHCPDIAQTLTVTYCLLNKPFIFKGVQSLRIKETDRIAALVTELHKIGYTLYADGDERLVWKGERTVPLPNPTITTYDDHRMAMAFAPAAICYDGLTIEHPEVVSKSYPGFWEDLNKLKTNLRLATTI